MRVICAWHKEEKIHRVANEDGPKPSYIVETGSHWMYGSNAYVNVKMYETWASPHSLLSSQTETEETRQMMIEKERVQERGRIICA